MEIENWKRQSANLEFSASRCLNRLAPMFCIINEFAGSAAELSCKYASRVWVEMRGDGHQKKQKEQRCCPAYFYGVLFLVKVVRKSTTKAQRH
jgi:hypothetical protein